MGKKILLTLTFAALTFVALMAYGNRVFCRYCGYSSSSVSSLTSGYCSRSPQGAYKGYHQPYAGGERSHYFCRYCGHKSSSISSLTSGRCSRSPLGAYKGYHQPLE